jgi:hypothetical protein
VLRIFLACLAGVALVGAGWLYNLELEPETIAYCDEGDATPHPVCEEDLGGDGVVTRLVAVAVPARKADWQDPVALALLVVGIGAAALAARTRATGR